jgi:hypothetical protein
MGWLAGWLADWLAQEAQLPGDCRHLAATAMHPLHAHQNTVQQTDSRNACLYKPCPPFLYAASYLSLHLALTGVVPVCIAACCDYMTRLSFQSHLAAQQQQQQETLGAAQHQKQPPQKLVAA